MEIKEYNYIEMNKASLKKLSKSQIKLLLNQKKRKPEIIIADDTKPVPAQRTYKPRPPVPTPRKSVKQMAKEYEENIILPPPEFRNDYKPIPTPRSKKPVPTPRTIIKQTDKALKGFTKSFEIGIRNNKDPLIQMQNTRKAIEQRVITLLNEMKGLKYVETLKVTFNKMSDGEIVIKNGYFNS